MSMDIDNDMQIDGPHSSRHCRQRRIAILIGLAYHENKCGRQYQPMLRRTGSWIAKAAMATRLDRLTSMLTERDMNKDDGEPMIAVFEAASTQTTLYSILGYNELD